MAKRSATSELNHENWDQEGEPEDPGTFKTLPSSELKDRVFAKAKRSLGSNNSPARSSPFALFSGFTSTPSTNSSFVKTNNDSLTNKLSSSNLVLKKENGETQLLVEKKVDGSKNSLASNSVGKLEKNSPATFEKKTEHNLDANQSSSSVSKEKATRSIEYYRQLQSLNESVLKWMQLHFSKNACCDFTPVFNDYKKHLDTLNVTYPLKQKETTLEKESDSAVRCPAKDSPQKNSNSAAKANSSFTLTNFNKDETDYGANFSSNTTNTSTFSFGQKTIPTATSSGSTGPTSSSKVEPITAESNLKSESSETNKGSFPFSFGIKNVQFGNLSSANKPFSFDTSGVKTDGGREDDEEYVPPKNDFNAVNEEDAVYCKRCKLFFKKDDTYAEKGVGILYLKPLDGKTQLLVRADTNLGNILLNIMLSSSLPMSRTGKNNVLLVCVPNPPLDAKKPDSKDAIPMLIRVKTAEDADELLEMLNKYKS